MPIRCLKDVEELKKTVELKKTEELKEGGGEIGGGRVNGDRTNEDQMERRRRKPQGLTTRPLRLRATVSLHDLV